MMIHDIIKIKYVNLGYIQKNYPYHLISDEEMFNAFIDLGNEEFNQKTTIIDPNVRFFDDYYPNPFAEEPDDNIYKLAYSALRTRIVDNINDYLAYAGTSDEEKHLLPDWVYTYMLSEVVYQRSEYLDIEDTLALLGCSNLDNKFTQEACAACYNTSLKYISTLSTGLRPPTIFGEPHVIKKLRMET